jgi:hypothetical protein
LYVVASTRNTKIKRFSQQQNKLYGVATLLIEQKPNILYISIPIVSTSRPFSALLLADATSRSCTLATRTQKLV